MKGANQRFYQGHRLVLLAPTAPTAPPAVVAALSLVPLVAVLSLTPWVTASLRARLCTGLSTSTLAVTSSRNGGSVARGSGGASSRDAGSVTRVRGASGSGAVLGSGVIRGGGTGRGSAGTVELALDEGEGFLTVLFAVALVGVRVAAVTAVWVTAVAVRLHLGAGLLNIVSMLRTDTCFVTAADVMLITFKRIAEA